jgi:hypothetical protein
MPPFRLDENAPTLAASMGKIPQAAEDRRFLDDGLVEDDFRREIQANQSSARFGWHFVNFCV